VGIFDWFGPSCPVEAEERAWLDERLAWLVEQFGIERIQGAEQVLPSPAFFPDPYDRTPDAALKMFERVKDYMGLGDQKIRVGFYVEEDEHPDVARRMPGVLYSSQGTAGLFHGFRGKVGEDLQIAIEAKQLAKPLSLVATIAHELAHVHLVGFGRLKGDEEDHEPVTDLLTILLGLGVFTANSLIQETNWQSGQWTGWSVGRLGYVSQLQAGYALGVFAWLRGEERPEWLGEVCSDVRAPLKATLKLLAKGDVAPALAALKK